MTSHYVDITVVSGPEFNASQLFGTLYDRLHLALVQQHREDVGVSFPGYRLSPRTLGTTLRLHGSENGLHQMLQPDWLKGIRDHVQIKDITRIPEGVEHRTVQRRQFKTNADRLRRRRMHRKGETTEQAAAAIPLSVERSPHLPYVRLHSRSTAQSFSLFIALGDPIKTPTQGSFNSHGLSCTTTVPWF